MGFSIGAANCIISGSVAVRSFDGNVHCIRNYIARSQIPYYRAKIARSNSPYNPKPSPYGGIVGFTLHDPKIHNVIRRSRKVFDFKLFRK